MFDVENCEVGTTLEYTIFNSLVPTTNITGSRTVTNSTESFDIPLPGIDDGTIVVSVILTDGAGNTSQKVVSPVHYPTGSDTTAPATTTVTDIIVSGVYNIATPITTNFVVEAIPGVYVPNYSFVAVAVIGGGNLGDLDYERTLMVEVKDLNPNNTFHIKIEKPDLSTEPGAPGPPYVDDAPHIFTYSGNDYSDSTGRMHNVFTHGFGGLNGQGLMTSSYHTPTFTVWETDGDTVYDAITLTSRAWNNDDFSKDKDGNERVPGTPVHG